MRLWIASLMLVLLMTTNTFGMVVKVTGYFPSGYKSKAQARIEGGKYDRWGNLLRTLQDYTYGSYVSVATDPRVIKSGTFFTIKEMPDILFYACDVGSAIKGNRLDICVKSEKHTYELPRKVTIEKKVVIKLENAIRRADVSKTIVDGITKMASTAADILLQELQRAYSNSDGNSTANMVWNDGVSYISTVLLTCVGLRETGVQRFCHK